MKRRMKIVSTMLALTLVLSTMVTGCKSSGANGGGGNGETLKLGVVNKGYGEEFAYKLAEAFEAKTGIDTEVTLSEAADCVQMFWNFAVAGVGDYSSGAVYVDNFKAVLP